MTRHGRAGLGRIVLALGVVLALGACDKGPDKATVAADLKAGVEAQLKLMEGSTATRVFSHSAVTVTPADDDFYLVAIEGVKVQPAPEGYLDIGTISYRAKPKDEKFYEVSDLKVPEVIPFKTADGKEEGKLTLKTKAFSGLYSKELKTFQKAEGEFTDITATDDKGGDLGIGSVKFASEMTDKGGGLYDLVANATLGGFAVKDDSGGTFALGEAKFDGKYDSIKVAEYQAAALKYQELSMKQLAAMEAAAKAVVNTDPNAQPDPNAPPPSAPALTEEEQKALTDAVVTMASSIKGGDFKIALKGLNYADASGSPFSLGVLNIGTTATGINEEKATVTFDIAHDGLALTGPDVSSPVDQATLPKSGNFGLKVTNLPSKELLKVMADNMPGMMSTDPSMTQANAMAMVFALQAVFQTSGAKVEVIPSQLVSQLAEVKADGMFDVNPQAAFGVIGGLNVVIRGMDDVMALAQQTPDDPSAQEVMGTIGMLSTYAKREQGADGKPIDVFNIVVGADGQMLVNDKPM